MAKKKQETLTVVIPTRVRKPPERVNQPPSVLYEVTGEENEEIPLEDLERIVNRYRIAMQFLQERGDYIVFNQYCNEALIKE